MSHQDNNNNSDSSGVEEKQSVRHFSHFVDQKDTMATKVNNLVSILPRVYGITLRNIEKESKCTAESNKYAP